MTATPAKGITIQGIGGPIEIRAGRFYMNTKSRLRELMKPTLSRRARQVYARLEEGTMGFQQELAVKMENGRKRPLTIDDISEDTGLSEADVRRALDELQAVGLAARRTKDGTENFVKGNVEIYSWAEPHAPDPSKQRQRAPGIPQWANDLPQSLTALAKRWRYRLPESPDDAARTRNLERAVEVARQYEAALEEAARFLDEMCAPPPLYKEEKTERTIYKERHPPASQPIEEPPAKHTPAPPPKPAPQPPPEPAPVPEEEPAGWPAGADLKNYLKTITQPGLTPEIVEEIGKHIQTPEALEQFKEETTFEKTANARTWKYFVKIAERVAADAPRYAAAKAGAGNGHSPPKSRSEMRRAAFVKEMEEEAKARGR